MFLSSSLYRVSQSYDSFLQSLDMVNYTNQFSNTELALNSQNKVYVVGCILLHIASFNLLNILLGIFHLYSWGILVWAWSYLKYSLIIFCWICSNCFFIPDIGNLCLLSFLWSVWLEFCKFYWTFQRSNFCFHWLFSIFVCVFLSLFPPPPHPLIVIIYPFLLLNHTLRYLRGMLCKSLEFSLWAFLSAMVLCCANSGSLDLSG